MQGYNNYAARKPAAAREKLPVGCYVAKIMNAEEVVGQYGRTLLVSFDIIEGEYKDFFRKDYEASAGNENRKWRGTIRMKVPTGDGSERDEWTKRSFEGNMWAIEDSNPGYHWDWNEKALKSKLIGVNYRNKEWEIDGNTGWTTECGRLESVEDVRAGRCKPMKDKPLKNSTKPANNTFTDVSDDLSDLPWTL